MSWLDVSLETGNRFYTWGWRGSILGAIITAVAVIFLMWGTRVRDHDAELQMDRANAGLDDARFRATSLEDSAKQSTIRQEEFRKANDELKSQIEAIKQPRTLSKDASIQITTALRASGRHTFQIMYVAMDPEAENLASQFSKIFEDAGWQIIGQVQPQMDLTRAPPIGVELGIKSQQDIPMVLESFVELIRKEKLIGPRVSVGLAPELADEQSLAIMIGRKPI